PSPTASRADISQWAQVMPVTWIWVVVVLMVVSSIGGTSRSYTPAGYRVCVHLYPGGVPRASGAAKNRVPYVTPSCFDGGMSNDAIITIRQESDRLATALTSADRDQQVPTCPEWTADDLLWHLTEVHEFWSEVLGTGATTEEEVRAIEAAKVPRPEEWEALLERRVAATESLIAQLEARGDEERAWFWFSAQQSVVVTRRMQTHEATI